MFVRNGGAVGGILATADVRPYSTPGNELRPGNVIHEGQAASTRNLDSFISRDGRYVVAVDSSYSVQGSTVVLAATLPRSRALRLTSVDEIEGLTQMRGPFVLALARRNRGSGASLLASFRIESDGTFSLIGSVLERPIVAPFVRGSLLEGRVFWITEVGTHDVLTLTMNDAGELSALQRQSLSIGAARCGANLNGRFLYCFGSGVALAAAVAEDGTLTTFSPFASTSPFSGTGASFIAKP